MADHPSDPAFPRLATSSDATPAKRSRIERLAVADDNQDFANYIRNVAEPLGVEVRCYSNGVDLCADLADFDPDLIVLDIMMPDMDGIETARSLVRAGWAGELVIASGCQPHLVNAAIARLESGPWIKVRTARKPLPLAALRRDVLGCE